MNKRTFLIASFYLVFLVFLLCISITFSGPIGFILGVMVMIAIAFHDTDLSIRYELEEKLKRRQTRVKKLIRRRR